MAEQDQQWMTWQSQGWLDKGPFGYISGGLGCDEPPNGCAWSAIYTKAQTAHALSPAMPVLVTTSFASAPLERMDAARSTAACGSTTCLQNSVDYLVTEVSDMANGENANLAAYHTWQAGKSNIGTAPYKRQWWAYQPATLLDAEEIGLATAPTTLRPPTIPSIPRPSLIVR